MNEFRVAAVALLVIWWAPALLAFGVAVKAMRRPIPETELERRLKEDREVATLDAIWLLPAYEKGARA